MADTPLKAILPKYVDPRKFAQQGLALRGNFDLKELTRLTPLLAVDEGEVHADLIFSINEQGVRCLSGRLNGQVSMICQRCLEPAPQDLDVLINLAVVWSDEDIKHLPKTLDALIVGEGQVNLYEVLEDELILGLPIVAYHKEMCVPTAYYSSGGNKTVTEERGDDCAANPFQVLKKLKFPVNPR